MSAPLYYVEYLHNRKWSRYGMFRSEAAARSITCEYVGALMAIAPPSLRVVKETVQREVIANREACARTIASERKVKV